jgi:uncharacterized protein (TIGR02996 family)
MSDEERAFLAAIHRTPDDATARLVFADWLQDRDQDARAAMYRSGVVKRFGVDFESPGGALTLSAEDVCDIPHQKSGTHTRTHPEGGRSRGRSPKTISFG